MRSWWIGILLGMSGIVGCDCHARTVARCTVDVNKAEMRLSHTTEVPTTAVEQMAIAKLELTGTQPIRACRAARTAVQLVRQAEAHVSIVYIHVPTDLDYGWNARGSGSESVFSPSPFRSGSDASSWSHSPGSSDTEGWSGGSGFGGSDGGSWSGGGGSDGGSWSGGGGSDGGGW